MTLWLEHVTMLRQDMVALLAKRAAVPHPIKGCNTVLGTPLVNEVINHLEERLLDQALAWTPYTPFFGVVRVAYPKA